MNMKTLTVICIASAVAAVATTLILNALGIVEPAFIGGVAGGVGGVIGATLATSMNQNKDTE
jgi:hypothetical protein